MRILCKCKNRCTTMGRLKIYEKDHAQRAAEIIALTTFYIH